MGSKKTLNNFREKQIRKLAYYRYLDGGCTNGKDLEDWHVCTKWWPWNWLWDKVPKKTLIVIILILSGLIFYDMPATKILYYALPAQIKEPLSQSQSMLLNYNISPEFYAKNLAPIMREFRYPLFVDFMDRVMFHLKYFRKVRPFVITHQSIYSHIYFKDGGANYSLIPFITLKNIGNATAIITSVNIQAINELKTDITYPQFDRILPIELFPNEELILFYGQEMPPSKFKSNVEILYKDLKESTYKNNNVRNFFRTFSKKIVS
ncbi:MAG: DUF2934 domain-containing protein [Candidatus Omnitrophica bacterium]|nr:DUF2934 domain-containing protein [Candidatus Omnitrophota bacterium]